MAPGTPVVNPLADLDAEPVRIGCIHPPKSAPWPRSHAHLAYADMGGDLRGFKGADTFSATLKESVSTGIEAMSKRLQQRISSGVVPSNIRTYNDLISVPRVMPGPAGIASIEANLLQHKRSHPVTAAVTELKAQNRHLVFENNRLQRDHDDVLKENNRLIKEFHAIDVQYSTLKREARGVLGWRLTSPMFTNGPAGKTSRIQQDLSTQDAFLNSKI